MRIKNNSGPLSGKKNAVAPAVLIGIMLVSSSLWVWNAVKFASCDFDPGYKCEAIHGVGVFIPPASLITAWLSAD